MHKTPVARFPLTPLLAALLASGAGGACTIGAEDSIVEPTPDPDPDPSPDPDPDPPPGDVTLSGDITADANLAGTVTLAADATIAAGVEITIAADTRFEGAQGAWLKVAGTLRVDGSAAAPVVFTPVEGAGGWAGIKVLAGGSATISHADIAQTAIVLKCEAGAAHCAIADSSLHGIGKAVDVYAEATVERTRVEDMANAGLSVSAGGTLTITDSTLLTSTHDIVVQSGGDLIIDHSEIGGAQGSYEHCNLHIGSSGSVLVTNSNITSSVYGLMLGGSAAATFTGNNFTGNDPGNDVLDLGGNTAVDMTGNYWDQGAPDPGTAFDTSGALATPVATAGPR